jgi:hypothetical protein
MNERRLADGWMKEYGFMCTHMEGEISSHYSDSTTHLFELTLYKSKNGGQGACEAHAEEMGVFAQDDACKVPECCSASNGAWPNFDGTVGWWWQGGSRVEVVVVDGVWKCRSCADRARAKQAPESSLLAPAMPVAARGGESAALLPAKAKRYPLALSPQQTCDALPWRCSTACYAARRHVEVEAKVATDWEAPRDTKWFGTP